MTTQQERCVEHRDNGAEVVDLDVFYGEKYEFQVGLANVGNITVEELELRYAVQEAYAKRCVLFPSRYIFGFETCLNSKNYRVSHGYCSNFTRLSFRYMLMDYEIILAT